MPFQLIEIDRFTGQNLSKLAKILEIGHPQHLTPLIMPSPAVAELFSDPDFPTRLKQLSLAVPSTAPRTAKLWSVPIWDFSM